MTIINATQHNINVYKDDVLLHTFEPTGVVARIEEYRESDSTIAGVPLVKKFYAGVKNLPNPKPGVVYIVSSTVVDVLRKQRNDIVAPDGLVRDDKGNIIGCTSFWYGG